MLSSSDQTTAMFFKNKIFKEKLVKKILLTLSFMLHTWIFFINGLRKKLSVLNKVYDPKQIIGFFFQPYLESFFFTILT